MTVDFFTGYAHESVEPEDVLASLIQDTLSVETAVDLEDWAGELGMDPEQVSVKKSYKLAIKQAPKVRKLLGDDFELFAGASH